MRYKNLLLPINLSNDKFLIIYYDVFHDINRLYLLDIIRKSLINVAIEGLFICALIFLDLVFN